MEDISNRRKAHRLFIGIGKAIDFDRENGIYGAEGAERFPWLGDRAPKNAEETAEDIFAYLEFLGFDPSKIPEKAPTKVKDHLDLADFRRRILNERK